MGDSNAQHLYAGMNEVSKAKGVCGIQLNTIVLPYENRYIDIGMRGYDWTLEKAEAFYAWLSLHPEIHTVFISTLWTRLFHASYISWNREYNKSSVVDNQAMLKAFCERLKQIGKKVVLITPSTFFQLENGLHESGLAYARWIQNRENSCPSVLSDSDAFILTEKEYYDKYKRIIDLFNLWEQEGFCSVLHLEREIFRKGDYHGLQNGTLYGMDASHITPPAAIELMQGVADDFFAYYRKR